MRIALMTNNYKPIIGGVPISIERLAAGLVRMGHEVTIFAPSYAKSQETEQRMWNRRILRNQKSLRSRYFGMPRL